MRVETSFENRSGWRYKIFILVLVIIDDGNFKFRVAHGVLPRVGHRAAADPYFGVKARNNPAPGPSSDPTGSAAARRPRAGGHARRRNRA